MLNFMLQSYDPKKYDISSLRWIMSGAAPVPVTLIEAYAKLGIEIHQVYGLTESCGPACLIGAATMRSRRRARRARRSSTPTCAWSTTRGTTSSPASRAR